MFRKLDMSLSKIQHEHGAMVVASRCDISFKQSAKLEDLLHVHTSVKKISAARIVLHQVVKRDDVLLVQADVELAFIDDNGRPKRIPSEFRQKFATI